MISTKNKTSFLLLLILIINNCFIKCDSQSDDVLVDDHVNVLGESNFDQFIEDNDFVIGNLSFILF
jgi:hypothetical protein